MIGHNPYESHESREPVGYYVARKIDPNKPGSKFRTKMGKTDGGLMTKEEAHELLQSLKNHEEYEIVPEFGPGNPIGLGSDFPPVRR